MQQNAFNTKNLCTLTGEIKPRASLTPTVREHMLNGKSAEECRKLVLSQDYNGIHIPSQEASDRSKAVRGRSLNHLG